MCCEWSQDEVVKAMVEYDVDGSGELELGEFITMYAVSGDEGRRVIIIERRSEH